MATNEQLVHQMYIAYYQRPADPDGLAYWVNQIEENGGWEAVAGAFGNPENAEYDALYGNMSRAELIAELYQSVFGRTAAEEEVAFWEASEHSDQNLGFAIINGAQNDDLALINNKVAFAELLVAEVDQAGFAELADVKGALADVTVDTNVADAIAGLVAEVSELAGLLADLQAANGAKDAFLLAAGQDPATPGTEKPATKATLQAKLDGAEVALVGEGGFAVADTEAVKKAKLSDAQTAAAENVTAKQKVLDDAQAAVNKVTGLQTAINLVASRTKAQEAADDALTAAQAAFAAANISYITLYAGEGDAFTLDSDDKVVVNPAITNDAQKADAAKVVATYKAEIQAAQLAGDASEAVDAAKADPLLSDNAALVTALETATTNLNAAKTAQKTLQEQINARDEALEAVTQLASLEKDITAADKALKDAGYDLVVLDGVVTEFGTSGDDVFLAGKADARINSFGAEGNDQLFIGTDFTLNTGALTDGDNTVLEVFFIQDGLNTEVTLETKAFGSASTAEKEVVITLLGVDASDLVLSDEGFISVA